MTGTGAEARLAALRMISSVLDDGASLGDTDGGGAADPRDRAYSRHLAYGTLRWLSALDHLAEQLLDKPLRRKDRDVHRLVLLGLFQLWQDGTASHAAVNETAGCARKLSKPWATGLINAVLRRFQREQDRLLEELNRREERFAHPRWLLAALKTDWPEDWERIAAANNNAAPLWLRLNAARDTAAALAGLRADGLHVTNHGAAGSAIRVDPARPVQALPGFEEGRVSVQDPAAQLAAGLLDCGPGQRVLDACAAPGGKACHLLERHPDIDLLALDRSGARLERVRENLRRLGFEDRLELRAADAADTAEWWDGRPFDRILLDAPCSATGVIRRHPEIKWLRSPEQVDEAASAQARLLDALWPLLKPGGILLYATCSVLRRENAGQISAFLERRPDAGADGLDAPWGRDTAPGRQILPGEQDMDGFYYARLARQA